MLGGRAIERAVMFRRVVATIDVAMIAALLYRAHADTAVPGKERVGGGRGRCVD
jgi:hypothetical protein